jgi:hypothetical protein
MRESVLRKLDCAKTVHPGHSRIMQRVFIPCFQSPKLVAFKALSERSSRDVLEIRPDLRA